MCFSAFYSFRNFGRIIQFFFWICCVNLCFLKKKFLYMKCIIFFWMTSSILWKIQYFILIWFLVIVWAILYIGHIIFNQNTIALSYFFIETCLNIKQKKQNDNDVFCVDVSFCPSDGHKNMLCTRKILVHLTVIIFL